MIIQLTDDWRVTTDPYNFKIEELADAKDKDGNPVKKWVIRGYYPNMSRALRSIPDHIAQSTGVGMLRDYIRQCDAVLVGISKRFPVDREANSMNPREKNDD